MTFEPAPLGVSTGELWKLRKVVAKFVEDELVVREEDVWV